MTTRLKFGRTMLGAAAVALLAGPAQAVPITFSNPAPITIPATGTSGPATPYPSTVAVSGVTGATSLTVTLTGLSHTFPADLDILLVAPNGATVLLLSDVGGGTDVVNINLTFADGAPAAPATLVSGTFSPTNIGTPDPFPAPAPAGPYGTTLAALIAGNPNGTYSLFVVDDLGLDVGSIAGGFSLTFEVPAVGPAVPEPASMTLLGLGVAGVAAARLRRRKIAAA